MKSRNLLLGFIAFSFIGSAALVASLGTGNQKLYQPKEQRSDNEIAGAIAWLAKIRNNQITGTIDINDILRAQKEIAQMQGSNKLLNIEWNELGPNNVGGRTRAILIDRNNPNVMFAGAVSGGLWKTTTGGSSWELITAFPDMDVACIAQSQVTGNIYVGTGESFANVDSPFGTPGFVGTGLYESTDGGATWHIFNNAKPTADNNTSLDWAFVNSVAVNPITDRVFAGTNKGLRFWDGSAWKNPLYLTGTTPNTGKCNLVTVSSDHSVIAVVGNKVYLSTSYGDDNTFTNVSPSTTAGRTEVAFAPSNPNYVYAVVAKTNGSLHNVYRSTNKCANWTIIGPGGAPGFDLFGDNNQGGYDNVISVNPFDPDHILVGGINIWQWALGANFQQINSPVEDDPGDFLKRYNHVDIHALVFSKTTPGIFYSGSDGGITKATFGPYGWTFEQLNKNYNTTQFYAVANSKTGMVMGGTQDNSNPFLSRTGFEPQQSRILFGGDGGWAAFSAINPEVFFGTMQYGGVWRSPDMGETFQSATDDEFFSGFMIGTATPGSTPSYAPFVTPLLHWESFSNYYSPDSVTGYYSGEDTIPAGTTVNVPSATGWPIAVTLTNTLYPGDSIRVHDIISSRFFVVLSNGIWMTKEALDFSKTPKWIKISDRTGIQTISISKDGNYLFAGTSSGLVCRISNLLSIKDSVNGYVLSPYTVVEQKVIESWSGREVTSIAIDPNNPANIVVTLGNYGNTGYIYYSSNALDADPTFVSKQGSNAQKKLPAMPLYASLIEMNNSKRVLVGTEWGIFATDDITKSAANLEWTQENMGMSPVPVFQIRQQTQIFPGMNNYGVIYIGTHGRGFFESLNYLSVPETESKPAVYSRPGLQIYPNPVFNDAHINFTLPSAAKVYVNIYNITGTLVHSADLSSKATGTHSAVIDCGMLKAGTYIMQLVAGKESATSKFIVTR